MIRLLNVLLYIGLLFFLQPARAANFNQRDEVDFVLADQVNYGFSGSVLIARGSEIILHKAYGSISNQTMQTDTRYWIASTAKQFVSASILRCRDKGLLSLDDPLERFFPDIPTSKKAITIRQLLSHASGLIQSYVSEGAIDRATAVSLILDRPLTDQPGHKFQYSNNNYQLASAIVEIVSGRSYQDFVRSEFLAPMAMSGTGFAGDAGSNLVASAQNDVPLRMRARQWGSQGIYSTTSDLYRWFSMITNGNVLSQKSTEELFAPTISIEEGSSALGWFLGKSPHGFRMIFTRGNEDFGANSLIYHFPDSNIVVVVLTHASNADDDTSWSRKILSLIQAKFEL